MGSIIEEILLTILVVIVSVILFRWGLKRKRVNKKQKRYMSGQFEIHPNAMKERDYTERRILIL